MADTVRTADGRKIACAQWGDPDGAPVVALHGTPGGRLGPEPVEDRLHALGVRLVTYDRPGYGWSDRHRGRRVVDCVGDVAAVVDHLGIDRFAAFGGSGGGPHVLAVAARLGDRVSRVRCAVGVAPYDADGLDFFEGMDPGNVREFGWALEGEERLAAELPAQADALRAQVAEDPATMLDDFDLPESDRAVLADDRVHASLRASVLDMLANGVTGWVDDDLALTMPWGFGLDEIAVPVEVRYGAQDVLVPAAHGRWLAAHVPAATEVVDTGGGHLTGMDDTVEQLRALALGK
jgi:pimeloyl-ACP methyl ester carboxylesterase